MFILVYINFNMTRCNIWFKSKFLSVQFRMITSEKRIGQIDTIIYENKPWRSQSDVSGEAAMFLWLVQ